MDWEVHERVLQAARRVCAWGERGKALAARSDKPHLMVRNGRWVVYHNIASPGWPKALDWCAHRNHAGLSEG